MPDVAAARLSAFGHLFFGLPETHSPASILCEDFVQSFDKRFISSVGFLCRKDQFSIFLNAILVFLFEMIWVALPTKLKPS